MAWCNPVVVRPAQVRTSGRTLQDAAIGG